MMVLFCVVGLWIVSGASGLLSYRNVTINLIDASPAKVVHEERFLLFLLELELDEILFYSHLGPEAATGAISETKQYAQSVVAHLETHPASNEGIIQSFKNVVVLADAYVAMVNELGGLEQAYQQAKGQKILQTSAEGAVIGYSAAQLFDSGDSKGAMVSILGALLSAWQKGQALESEKKVHIEQLAATFSSRMDQARTDAIALADVVSKNHGWNRNSVGLLREWKPYGQEQLRRPTKELIQILADRSLQAPLNPILQFKKIMLEDSLDGDATTQQKHLDWAASFVELARLVPSGDVYEYYRWRYMMRAGTMALKAAEQAGKGKRLGESPESAATAASYWKTALSINPADSDGSLRWGYGHSLALAGDLDEAQSVLSSIKDLAHSNPDYHYLLARISSLNRETDQALEHLKNAIAKGFDNIADARGAQDLENLRNVYGDSVSSMLAVKFGWSITYGTFNDDITITNQSLFPLTHLVLSPVISNSNGSYSPKQPLTLEKLGAGKSHTWVNCVSVKGGGNEDRRKAELQCDQSPH